MKHPLTSNIGADNVVHTRPIIKKIWKRGSLDLQGNSLNMRSLLSLLFVYVWLCLHFFWLIYSAFQMLECLKFLKHGQFYVPYLNTPISLAIYSSD